MNDTEFQKFNTICTRLGQDPLIVQGAGGNASWKSEDTIWIKASGTWLAKASTENIFLPIRRPSQFIDTILNGRAYQFDPLDSTYGRPSIETVLHCLLEQRLVVHVHAITPLALLVREDAKRVLATRLADKLSSVFVPYAKPGEQLGREVACSLAASESSSNLILLANHGVVIAGETIDDIIEDLDLLCALCKPEQVHKPKRLPPPTFPLDIDGAIYRPVCAQHLHALATDKHLVQLATNHWALYPDHVVFLGPTAPIYESTDHARQSKCRVSAPFIFIKGVGVWQKADVSSAALAQLQCYDVLTRLEHGCKLVNLSERQINDLLHWDAEKHRQSLNR